MTEVTDFLETVPRQPGEVFPRVLCPACGHPALAVVMVDLRGVAGARATAACDGCLETWRRRRESVTGARVRDSAEWRASLRAAIGGR